MLGRKAALVSFRLTEFDIEGKSQKPNTANGPDLEYTMKNTWLMITYLDPVNWETLREAINLLLRLYERRYLEQPEYYVQLRQKIRPSLPQRWGRSSLLALTRGPGLAVGQHNIDLVLHLARSRKENFMSPL